MKTYVVQGIVTISVTTQVRAKSKAAAIEAAREYSGKDFCHSCSDTSPEHEQWAASEIDGEVEITGAEEMR
jgi:hypothetical protein